MNSGITIVADRVEEVKTGAKVRMRMCNPRWLMASTGKRYLSVLDFGAADGDSGEGNTVFRSDVDNLSSSAEPAFSC